VTDDTSPAEFVWQIILAQVRELRERAITVGATLVGGAFLFRGEGCEAAWNASDSSKTQANIMEKAILFITEPFEMKPPKEMNLPG
jgi:hypothetical protein